MSKTRSAVVPESRPRQAPQRMTRSGLPPAADAALRAGFAWGERLTPGLAARPAANLFLRLPPAPSQAKRHRAFSSGEPIPVRLNGAPIVAERWGEGPTVHLVHGWGGWRQQLGVYVEPLVAHGFSVVSYDGPSHGDSAPGRHGSGRTTMLELADALAAVVAATAPPFAVIAHSGAAIATGYAMSRPGSRIAPQRLALISASVDTADMLASFTGRFGIGPRSAATMVERLQRSLEVTMTDFDLPAAIGPLQDADRLPQLLAVHDPGDPETPFGAAEALTAQWPGAALRSVPGAGHHALLWHPATVAAVLSFLSTPSPVG